MARLDAPEARVLKALSHPLRMRLLTFITERGEASPVEMSRALDQPLATVSHHTRVLRDSGCIELARTEPRRGAMEHYYRATEAPFLDDEQWAQLSVPARRRVAAQLVHHVLRDAAAAAQSDGFNATNAHVARMVLDLDERGWRELSGAVLTLLERAQVIQEHSDGRRESDARGSHDSRPSELAVLHFAFGQPQSPAGASRDRQRRVRPSRLPR